MSIAIAIASVSSYRSDRYGRTDFFLKFVDRIGVLYLTVRPAAFR
jgi:hypothetical protein